MGVFGFGEEDVEGVFAGVDERDELAELGFGEGGAARGGLGTAAAPDVEEDGGAGAGGRFGRGVVGDEEFEGMGVVVLFHLRLLLPGGAGFVVEDEVVVVVFGGGVLYPEVASGDFAVREARVLFDLGVIAPGAADVEDAGGGAPIAFAFDGAFESGVDAASPGEALFSAATSPRAGDLFPGLAAFLVDVDGDLGGAPAFGDADHGLSAAAGEFEGGGGEGEEEGEENAAHFGYQLSVIRDRGKEEREEIFNMEWGMSNGEVNGNPEVRARRSEVRSRGGRLMIYD